MRSFVRPPLVRPGSFSPKVLKHSLGVLHPLRFLNPYSGSFSPDSAEQCNAVPLGGSINKSLIVLIK